MCPSIIQKVPLSLIYANEEQARKIFDEAKLHELAASIRAEGLISPITVRPDGTGKFMIVAGERRYRACTIAGLEEVDAIVKELGDDSLTYQMIIENLQRVDITALEEARSWRKAMDDHDLTPEQFAAKVGIQQVFRVHDRLTLLNLKPEYQAYMEQGILNPTQAFYLGKVSQEHQAPFWNMIKSGKVDNGELAAVAQSFVDAANQDDMFPEVVLTEEQVRAVKGMREHIATMYATLTHAMDLAFELYHEIQKTEGIVYDGATPTYDRAELQLKTLVNCYRKMVAPSIEPVEVEVRLEADIGDGFVLSGQFDVREIITVRDLKTGAASRAHISQYGSYALLCRVHGRTVEQIVEDYLPRKKEPEPEYFYYDAEVAVNAARAILKRIKDDVAAFRTSGEPTSFIANPQSMLCSDRFCPVWGTAFCREHKSKGEKE